MHIDDGGTERGQRLHCARHGVGNVMQLHIEEDRQAIFTMVRTPSDHWR